MSGSSQSTGDNYLSRVFGTGNSQITICGWFKPRYDKGTFGQIFALNDIGGTIGGADDHFCGIQQDPDAVGGGLADNFRFFWYDSGGTGAGGGYEASGDVITGASPGWYFLAIVADNTTMTAYWGTEAGGSLSSWTSGTMGFNASTLSTAHIGSDLVNERCDVSARGVRLWVGAALTQSELEDEWESSDFSPVRTSNLHSDIRIPNGTNPHVATTGTNWSLTGTFADDSSNPTPPSSGTSITATVAASITGDLTPAATASESIPSTVAVSIAGDFTVAATASESIPGTVAASIAGDFTVAATSTVANPVTATVAASIADDFTIAASATETIPSTIAAAITNDFTVAVAASSATSVTSTAAVTITTDVVPAAIAMTADADMLLATSGHHLVDGNASPRFLLIDAAWSLAVELTREQVDDYLDTRQAQGFNGVIWEMIESGTFGGTANAYGEEPFTSANDFDSPNPAYWAHVDYIQGALAKRGMYSFANGLYLGYDTGGSHPEGWYDQAAAAGATVIQDYGEFLGLRYKDHPQLVWGNYGDTEPASHTIPDAFRAGFETYASQLVTNHLNRNTTGTDAGDSPTLNTSYTSDNNVFSRIANDWADTPTLATGLYEGHYQGSFPSSPTLTALDVRRQLWHAATAGATYVSGGNHKVWQFQSGWESTSGGIDDDYGTTAGYLPALWSTIRWYDLEPQASGVMVTSGEGSGVTYVSAAKTSDDKLAVLYLPDGSGSSATVALGEMVNAVRTRWYDPTDGSTQTAGAGSYVGAGNTSFTKPGANAAGDDDWVLLVEEQTNASVAVAITGDFTVAASATETIPSTAAVTIAGDFTTAATVTETIPGTVAAVITDDFSASATSTVANPVTSTVAVDITGDFSAAQSVTESIPATVAAVIGGDFAVSATSTVANPISATVAADVTGDFAVSATLSESIPSTIAAAITGDFTVSASGSSAEPVTATAAVAIAGDFSVSATLVHSVEGDIVIAVSIGNDFAVAASATETIPSTASADIDLSVSASTLLEFTSSGAASIANDFTPAITASEEFPLSGAVEISDLFIVEANGSASNDVSGQVAASIGGDFTVAAFATVAQAVSGNLAVDITADFAPDIRLSAPAPYRSITVTAFVPHVTPTSRIT